MCPFSLRLLFQVLGWAYLTGCLSEGEKKHINLAETSYLMSLRSHIALIFLPFTFLVEVFPWVESIFKAFCFHPPRTYALVTFHKGTGQITLKSKPKPKPMASLFQENVRTSRSPAVMEFGLNVKGSQSQWAGVQTWEPGLMSSLLSFNSKSIDCMIFHPGAHSRMC